MNGHPAELARRSFSVSERAAFLAERSARVRRNDDILKKIQNVKHINNVQRRASAASAVAGGRVVVERSTPLQPGPSAPPQEPSPPSTLSSDSDRVSWLVAVVLRQSRVIQMLKARQDSLYRRSEATLGTIARAQRFMCDMHAGRLTLGSPEAGLWRLRVDAAPDDEALSLFERGSIYDETDVLVGQLRTEFARPRTTAEKITPALVGGGNQDGSGVTTTQVYETVSSLLV
jgi:hypothetical protein